MVHTSLLFMLIVLMCWTEAYIHVLLKSTETLVVASNEIGLEVNADKTKYLVTSRDQNARRSHRMNIDNSSFERVEQFKYLGTTLTH